MKLNAKIEGDFLGITNDRIKCVDCSNSDLGAEIKIGRFKEQSVYTVSLNCKSCGKKWGYLFEWDGAVIRKPYDGEETEVIYRNTFTNWKRVVRTYDLNNPAFLHFVNIDYGEGKYDYFPVLKDIYHNHGDRFVIEMIAEYRRTV